MAIRREQKKRKQRKNRGVRTPFKLRCTAIQKFLVDQTTGSEKSIRSAFGDNPDTSKALRMLVNEHKVKRSGRGGRYDPFVYMALVPARVSDLECLKEAKEAHGMYDSLDME